MKKKAFLPLSSKLFLIVTALALTLVLVFVFYQYRRENEYRVELLNTKMQGYNKEMGSRLVNKDTTSFLRYERRLLRDGVRTTILDYEGNVLFDNEASNSIKKDNHLGRKEIRYAISLGKGYDIKRESANIGGKWFYSATAFPKNGFIVRTSHPYNMRLSNVLGTNRGYLWIGLAICIMLIILYYIYIGHINKNIKLLRSFAEHAEKNDDLTNFDVEFADDELGEISKNIVSLYAKLNNSEDDKTRLKRQLTQNIAHELKTPVSSISGYIETILDNPDMDENTKKQFLESSFSQCQRLTNLINDITLLTKLDESCDSFTTEDINIHDLIDSVYKDVTLQLQKRGMKFLNLVGPNVVVNGNQMLLYSIFRNLTDNAIAYAGEYTTVTVQNLKQNEGFYWFNFTDNGVGVPEENQEHLFERFYRVDKGRSRKLGGTGLGLAIVKNAVLIHGGWISVRTASTGGLEFIFSLAKSNSK